MPQYRRIDVPSPLTRRVKEMSIKVAQKEILRFLSAAEPEVLCISGRWGVGKTFAWNALLREATEADRLALRSHSYVSLFGLDSLTDVRTAIVEATRREGDSTEPREKFGDAFHRLKAYVSLAQRNAPPAIRDYIATNPLFLFSSVREQIVCIDDMERRGRNLELRDVFGIISDLKERRSCKVVVLLNHDELGDSAPQFDALAEKVCDVILQFNPTAEECADIGLDNAFQYAEYLKQCISKLRIVNIRVLRKIERLSKQLVAGLGQIDERVLKQAIHSATIRAFSRFCPSDAPNAEWLAKYSSVQFFTRDEDRSDEEKQWISLLQDYNLTDVDAFDLEVFAGVDRGYFDFDALSALAAELASKFEFNDQDNSMTKAWNLYHESFDDNLDEVLDGLASAFQANFRSVSPMNVNGLVRIFKELGRSEQGLELLKFYIDNREAPFGFWDLDDYAFGSEIDDADVVEAFRIKAESLRPNAPSPSEVFQKIATESGWNPSDIDILANATEDDFYKMFKEKRGKQLRRIVNEALNFRSRGAEGSRERAIGAKADAALERIAAESPINARRVRVKRNNAR